MIVYLHFKLKISTRATPLQVFFLLLLLLYSLEMMDPLPESPRFLQTKTSEEVAELYRNLSQRNHILAKNLSISRLFAKRIQLELVKYDPTNELATCSSPKMCLE